GITASGASDYGPQGGNNAYLRYIPVEVEQGKNITAIRARLSGATSVAHPVLVKLIKYSGLAGVSSPVTVATRTISDPANVTYTTYTSSPFTEAVVDGWVYSMEIDWPSSSSSQVVNSVGYQTTEP